MNQVKTDEAPKADHLLSQAVVSSGLVFVAGQVHVLPDNTLIGDTTTEKFEQIMKNIQGILQAAGTSSDNAVKVTIYLTDMSLMPELNEVYGTYFSNPLPAREAVCVKELPLGASIEISVIAELPAASTSG